MNRIVIVCSYFSFFIYISIFLCIANGAVFVTGDNENQKLGIPNTATTVFVPEVLPLDIQIKSACCGANHTFLLSMDEAKILAFGSNEKGQLGMGQDVFNVVEPTEIDMDKMFDGYQLKLVACGAMHTAFVTGTYGDINAEVGELIFSSKYLSFFIPVKRHVELDGNQVILKLFL